MTMKKLMTTAVILTAMIWGNNLFAHCEVPCGIYNDELRIAMLYEDITTI